MSEYVPVIHRHDFSGGCSPKEMGRFPGQETFSVGIFEWLPKASGHGLKKGPVKVRVRAFCCAVEEVERVARRICKELDVNQYHGPKTVRVGNCQ